MLADRLGKKRLLAGGRRACSWSPAAVPAGANPFWLIPLRFFHGIATAILGPVASAFIVSAYPESKGEKLGAVFFGDARRQDAGSASGRGASSPGSCFSAGPHLSGGLCGGLPPLRPRIVPRSLRFPDARPGAGGERPPGVTPADFARSLAAFVRNRRLLGTSLVEMATYFAYGVPGDLPADLPVRPGRARVPDRPGLLPADPLDRPHQAAVRKAGGHGRSADPDPCGHRLPGGATARDPALHGSSSSLTTGECSFRAGCLRFHGGHQHLRGGGRPGSESGRPWAG